jgi:two-component sensor histidine kinase
VGCKLPLNGARPTDQAACERLWRLIDANRERLAREVQLAAREMNAGGALEPVIAELAGFATGEAQRAALCSGNWAAYEGSLRERGVACAETGVELHAWFELIEVYQAALLEAGPSLASDELRATMAALRGFVMANIVQGYARARRTSVQFGDAMSSLFAELFHDSPSPTLIYRSDDRQRFGPFRLIVANTAAAQISHARLLADVARSLHGAAPEPMALREHPEAPGMERPSGSWTFTTDSGPPSNRTYLARGFPLAGNCLGVALDDITDRLRMEDDVRRHVAELERSNRELDDFAHAASHDLKSPLNDIKNLCNWIGEDLGDGVPPDTRRHFALILDRLARLERLLDDLLAYSRAGRERPPAEQFSVSELLAEVIALSPVPAGFRVEVRADVGPIRTPKSPLAQVMRNLLGNALKHHDLEQGTIHIEATEAGGRVQFSVSDDGPGIPREFHERVFRIFQTLKPRDEVDGSGVGLALVKKVVETHGGTVAIDSVGRGTTVRFNWPREVDI